MDGIYTHPFLTYDPNTHLPINHVPTERDGLAVADMGTVVQYMELIYNVTGPAITSEDSNALYTPDIQWDRLYELYDATHYAKQA